MDSTFLEYAQQAGVVVVVFIFVKFISEIGKEYIQRKRSAVEVKYVCQLHVCPHCGCEFRTCVTQKRREDETVFNAAADE